ncbi:MAG: MBL fold metallo-hydrolase, partial [Bacillota bacterium]|nr:MBL fold metallo-hydrolase [Bacillota bacterium]
MIEANHDINMLMVGKYPYYLKQRILGDLGHLSNETSAGLISKLINKKKQHIILGHLSKENNYEELAYETVLCELSQLDIESDMYSLTVARRDAPSDLVII